MKQAKDFGHVRIGGILKEYGYVTDQEIDEALAYQKKNKGIRLGKALIELGFISEEQMLTALGARLGLKLEKLPQVPVDLEAAAKIPGELAERYQILPIGESEGVLTVLVNDPLDFYGIEDIRQASGMDLELRLCAAAPLEKGIRHYYAEIAARREADRVNESREIPVIRLLDHLMQRAYWNSASDIHIEPFEDKTVVRMRIDGVMSKFVTLNQSVHQSLIVRVKILGNMDIAEHRLPQDGHFQMEIEKERVNVRVSVVPTLFGEKAVIRLLSSNSQIDHPDTFGMDRESWQLFKHMLDAPYGLIYFTGPTGSGKTTTLYMVLDELAKRPVNIGTIEDPAEKVLTGICQCQVNHQTGMSFEKGLRALLRQDPDIIMVGETRDSETAAISVRAAITGHLVLSTLHTNDAAASITRLEDMGIEPYLAASSLVGIVAQRLLRKLCPQCSKEVKAGQEEQELMGRKTEKIRVPVGCPACRGTGYRGRVAIHEILVIDKQVRQMIVEGASADRIREYAIKNQGMKTLRECGAGLVEQGITTAEELRKAVYYDERERFEKKKERMRQ